MSVGQNFQMFRDAIAKDRARVKSHILIKDFEFLPAALEVIERPTSPTARMTAWVLLLGLLATFCWLILSKIDVVVSAQGRVLPTEDVKLVQAANAGVVRHIYVHEGDLVQKGQPLIDLDPTVSTAEETQAAKALAASELDVARNRAIADALSGRGVHFEPPVGTPLEVIETQRRLIAAQVAGSEAGSAGMAAARQSSLADADAAAHLIRTYRETLPVLDRELSAMNGLAAKGYAPGLKLLELQRQRRTEAGQRDVAVSQQERGFADARKFGQQLTQLREQARQTALVDLAKAQNEVILRREELTKAREKSRLQQLVAPVDGTVQQLAMHTLGGVVEPVKPLMVIVPRGALTVEAKVLNRDAGFVKVGQPVAMKLAAFPFTKYGTVPGRILSISRDTVPDDKIGPYFIVRITLLQTVIQTDSGAVPISSGLTTENDIRTGQRTIMSYLLSPIDKARLESGRER
ncbi:MAG: type secretion rane fusion protein HlyD family [Sphingomonadales bacterium]|nr:type secretion rane fusion protein HlyD family [Sphingomonadales bacterium]